MCRFQKCLYLILKMLPRKVTVFAVLKSFVPQYMRVSDQASHSICSIWTCNHEVVIFYDTPSLVNFCYCPSKIFSCLETMFFVKTWCVHVSKRSHRLTLNQNHFHHFCSNSYKVTTIHVFFYFCTELKE